MHGDTLFIVVWVVGIILIFLSIPVAVHLHLKEDGNASGK